MVTTRTQTSRLDLGAMVLEERVWSNNCEGIFGIDIMWKHSFIIHFKKKKDRTEGSAKRLKTVLCPSP